MDTITIAGQKFKGVGRDCTLEHDVWVMKRIRSCQLQGITIHPSETTDQFAQRVFLQCAGDPAFMELLGGLLMPADRESADWSVQMAADTGRFFMGVSDQDDKQKVKQQIVSAIIGFLALGVTSLPTSGSSSPRTEAAPSSQTAE